MFIDAPTDTLRIAAAWERPASSLIERFADVPAAIAGDALDRLLVLDSAISPVTRTKRLVGPALPILTRAGDNLAIHRALDDAQPGDILVINGQGDLSRALIGDLIGEIMVSKGVLGAVIDGAVRDAETLAAQGLVVFARAATPAGPFKNGPGVIGAPVAVGGVVVSAGDLIVTDSDGVVLVPRHRATWAAEQVDQVIEKEEALRRRIVAARG
jgi:regulator of RNase E activity RraA